MKAPEGFSQAAEKVAAQVEQRTSDEYVMNAIQSVKIPRKVTKNKSIKVSTSKYQSIQLIFSHYRKVQVFRLRRQVQRNSQGQL